jgi:hypothetical protein
MHKKVPYTIPRKRGSGVALRWLGLDFLLTEGVLLIPDNKRLRAIEDLERIVPDERRGETLAHVAAAAHAKDEAALGHEDANETVGLKVVHRQALRLGRVPHALPHLLRRQEKLRTEIFPVRHEPVDVGVECARRGPQNRNAMHL